MYEFSRGTVDGGLLYRCIRNGRKVEALLRESGILLRLTEDLYSVGFRARHFLKRRRRSGGSCLQGSLRNTAAEWS